MSEKEPDRKSSDQESEDSSDPIPRTDDYISKHIQRVDVGEAGGNIFIDFQVADIRPHTDKQGSTAGFSATPTSTATMNLADHAAKDLARAMKRAVEDQFDIDLESEQDNTSNGGVE